MSYRHVSSLATALLAAGLLSSPTAAAAGVRPVIHFVVDVSGSMSGVPLEQANPRLAPVIHERVAERRLAMPVRGR